MLAHCIISNILFWTNLQVVKSSHFIPDSYAKDHTVLRNLMRWRICSIIMVKGWRSKGWWILMWQRSTDLTSKSKANWSAAYFSVLSQLFCNLSRYRDVDWQEFGKRRRAKRLFCHNLYLLQSFVTNMTGPGKFGPIFWHFCTFFILQFSTKLHRG